MRSKNQERDSEESHISREVFRQAVLFWIFWSLYVVLSAILITALFTNWPSILHISSSLSGR